MGRPVINIADLGFDDVENNGLYTSRRARISNLIGATKLGYNLTVLPPGKAQCPFHSHRGEEEMFFILDGEGVLRFGGELYPLRPYDVIACPVGGSEVAHQIINSGTVDLRYLALSTKAEVEVCEYPDSDKILISAETEDGKTLRAIFRQEEQVQYYDREITATNADGKLGLTRG